MKECIAALDFGGTFLKACLFDEKVHELSEMQLAPINSRGSKEEIFETLLMFLQRLIGEHLVSRIAVSTPGPFYYEPGYSAQTGKYGAINGIPLRPVIRNGLKLPESVPIDFLSDSISFLIGECYFGAGKGCRNVAAITLGTGLGYAAMHDGHIVTNMRGRPYDLPYREKWNGVILDDICSGRGLALSYYRATGKQITAADMARQRDEVSLQLYAQMGELLGTYLKKYMDLREIQRLIVGGQVSKSFELFAEPLIKGLKGVEVCIAQNMEYAALYGAAAYSLGMVEPWERHEE